jgi:UDP:flavonoid glycosyltransferase YjiC (YdhE family)
VNHALRPKNIVIATIGSLGDLHPCLALGQELASRGCRVTIATTPYYREKVEGCGLLFLMMRPDWDPTDARMIRSCEDLKRGLEVLYRQMLLPELKNTYCDLFLATADADLLITGELVYAAPLVAEKRGLPWVSLILSPFSFFSCIDPSYPVNLPILFSLRKAGPTVYKAVINVVKLTVKHWSNPVRQLRREEGLSWRTCDPVFKDKFSPYLVLAMFSQWFAPKQGDWPEQTLQPGFLHRSNSPDAELADQLDRFLSDGDPPLVFTQGSTAVHNPRGFYEISREVAKRLGCRALLVGPNASEDRADGILSVPYIPYSHVFPRAAAIVHQGGAGTTGDALRSGRPMLVVPYGWDQPDNAMRIERLGAGLHLPRKEYNVEAATRAIRQLLNEPRFSAISAEIGARMRVEDPVGSACDAISALLYRTNQS